MPDSARRHSGRFPETAGPNEVLYRATADGNVTNYRVYKEDGLPAKRVGVTGRPHGGRPQKIAQGHWQRYLTSRGDDESRQCRRFVHQ
ncbi:polymorphic toxin type 24 domain-containing protein [Frankia sp. AgKG'84/4]|uniref:polymorphic toxin type 24 domain-containing protein n=1 Tax=Frankia sp. AgKG'84/4 TaxID=573490 RepID=UPI0035B47D84